MTSWPEGAHLTIGLWFDRPVVPSALLAVGDALEAAGARYTGALYAGPPRVPFSFMFDIEGIGHVDGLDVAAVRDHVREGRAYRVSMRLPGLGPIALTYEAVPDAPVPADQHPIDVVMEAGVLDVPREYREHDERAAAEAMEPVVLALLEQLCAALDPAYAELLIEGETAGPAMLAAGEPLSWDCYLAQRVADMPEVRRRLAEAAGMTRTRQWRTGTFYSGWWLGDPPDREAFRPAWEAVGQAVGRSLLTD